MSQDDLVLVTGAGGFIGGHLVSSLLADGCCRLRAVDVKPLEDWFQVRDGVENLRLDLRLREDCLQAARGVRRIYNLAADMGGMGFIEKFKADCMVSVLINTHMLLAAKAQGCERYFYSSSACVYAADKQRNPDVVALSEGDAYPAMPEDGYGWEKLFSERMCRHFSGDYGLVTRIARYHNVYGELGTYAGGREKAPAAICRKVAEAKISGRREIEIWGDGAQTRSFMYITDCVYGTKAIMEGHVSEPINLGSDELVTIDQLVGLVEEIAGLKLKRTHDLSAPQGVRGRNSDNAMIQREFDWAPSVRLVAGLERTYRWIFDQLAGRGERRRAFIA